MDEFTNEVENECEELDNETSSSLTKEIREMLYKMASQMEPWAFGVMLLTTKKVVTEILDELYSDDSDDNTSTESNKLAGFVFRSRYTPGLEDASEVPLKKGETVKWRSLLGDCVDIIIDSDLMTNDGHLGYECIFTDTDERAFACADQIIDWEGKN
jgi:hypothetical protein